MPPFRPKEMSVKNTAGNFGEAVSSRFYNNDSIDHFGHSRFVLRLPCRQVACDFLQVLDELTHLFVSRILVAGS